MSSSSRARPCASSGSAAHLEAGPAFSGGVDAAQSRRQPRLVSDHRFPAGRVHRLGPVITVRLPPKREIVQAYNLKSYRRGSFSLARSFTASPGRSASSSARAKSICPGRAGPARHHRRRLARLATRPGRGLPGRAPENRPGAGKAVNSNRCASISATTISATSTGRPPPSAAS